jgi:hypothetical protein
VRSGRGDAPADGHDAEIAPPRAETPLRSGRAPVPASCASYGLGRILARGAITRGGGGMTQPARRAHYGTVVCWRWCSWLAAPPALRRNEFVIVQGCESSGAESAGIWGRGTEIATYSTSCPGARTRGSMAPGCEGTDVFEDLVGGLGPDVGPEVVVPGRDPARISALSARTDRWARCSFLFRQFGELRSTRSSQDEVVGVKSRTRSAAPPRSRYRAACQPRPARSATAAPARSRSRPDVTNSPIERARHRSAPPQQQGPASREPARYIRSSDQGSLVSRAGR